MFRKKKKRAVGRVSPGDTREDTGSAGAAHAYARSACLDSRAAGFCSGGMLIINKLAVHHVGAPAFVTLVQFIASTLYVGAG